MTKPTIQSGNNTYPPTVIDAIGGEPAGIMIGDAHVKLLTWHGVTPPYTFANAQVLYVNASDAYNLADCLREAADRLLCTLLDRDAAIETDDSGD
jgi:hypothetical protein